MNYNLLVHKQFIKEVEEIGYEISLYHGRNFFHGPCIKGNDLQNMIRATSVQCNWDSLGLGFVVYPEISDPFLGKNNE
jgi:hypothetical protein